MLSSPKNKKQKLARIIRVNQAGEYGAKRIYLGQLAVLKNHKEIKHMLDQELAHLDYFDKQVRLRKVRPTFLQPAWHVGGFALGAITALMGEKAAMACTVAVEEVIGEHYAHQLGELKHLQGENDLVKNIAKFKDEELEHKDKGLKHGAEDAVCYDVLKGAVKAITKVAIFLSKRI